MSKLPANQECHELAREMFLSALERGANHLEQLSKREPIIYGVLFVLDWCGVQSYALDGDILELNLGPDTECRSRLCRWLLESDRIRIVRWSHLDDGADYVADLTEI